MITVKHWHTVNFVNTQLLNSIYFLNVDGAMHFSCSRNST